MRSNKKVDLGAIECSSLNVSSSAGATGGGSITPLAAGRSLITSTRTFDTLAGYFLFICAVWCYGICKTFLMVNPLLSDLTTAWSQDDKPFDSAPTNTPILRTAIFANRNTGAFKIAFEGQAGTNIKIESWKLFAI